jgi:alkyl hydroperoxide reductase subunit AhpC
MASFANTANGAGGNALAHSLRGALQLPLGRDATGRLTDEYGVIRAEVSNTPRRTLLTAFRLLIAGQR